MHNCMKYQNFQIKLCYQGIKRDMTHRDTFDTTPGIYVTVFKVSRAFEIVLV
jgi:hypothetical protein